MSVRILEKKGAVGHEVLGKSHRYYPLFGREAYTQNLMQGVVRNFFGNSFARMVSFFCEKEHLPVDESEKIPANRAGSHSPEQKTNRVTRNRTRTPIRRYLNRKTHGN